MLGQIGLSKFSNTILQMPSVKGLGGGVPQKPQNYIRQKHFNSRTKCLVLVMEHLLLIFLPWVEGGLPE